MPSSATVRVTPASAELLESLAKQERKTKQAIIEQALEMLRRNLILAQTNAAYRALRQDPKAWGEFVKECEEWDSALGDGL